MSNQDLPVGDPETFIGEHETMDLSELYDKSFCVAISTGDRNKASFLCSTLVGPLDFFEMVETVAAIWKDHQYHAKAMIISKKFGDRPKVLDECTIDYIEARSLDIVMKSLLTGEIDEYTCKAGYAEHDENELNNLPHSQ